MAVNPKGPPYKPGPSLRGRLVFDTLRGQPRVRKWPPPAPLIPGSRREFTANAFRSANRACKVTCEPFQSDNQQVTAGTPMLPRDLMIAFMYGRAFALVKDDGSIIWSAAVRSEVSKSLDTLGATPGDRLVRGVKYWEPQPAPAGNANETLIYKANDQTAVNVGSGVNVAFTGVLYSAPGSLADPVNNSAIITPAGFNWVELYAQVELAAVATGQVFAIRLRKNGSATVYPGQGGSVQGTSAISCLAPAFTAKIPTVPGDSWTTFTQVATDTSVTIKANSTWMWAAFYE